MYPLANRLYLLCGTTIKRGAEFSVDRVASCLRVAHLFGRQLIYVIKGVRSLPYKFAVGAWDF